MPSQPDAATSREDVPVPELERPGPLDPPMLPFVVGGMVAWAVAGLVLLPMHAKLAAHGHGSWLWICLVGFLLGLPGAAAMARHDANRRRRRAAAATSVSSR